MIQLSSIHPNPRNPRTIKDSRFKKLKASIEEFPKMMELRPIVVDDDGMILGGNMRFRALKDLGFKEIPDDWVKRATELTEDEKRRFTIEDNLPFGEWDFDVLAADFEIPELVALGFDPEELLGPAPPEGTGEPGVVPDKDPNVMARISFHPGIWLGKREEIMLIFEKLKKTYSCDVRVEE